MISLVLGSWGLELSPRSYTMAVHTAHSPIGLFAHCPHDDWALRLVILLETRCLELITLSSYLAPKVSRTGGFQAVLN